MIALVTSRLNEIAALCRQHRVARLDLFGSAVSGSFNPARSDLDFALELQPMPPITTADCYFGIKEGLEALFGRKADIVMTQAVQNPFLLSEIEATREPLYVAEVEKAD